ncbi:MAG: hypothetical protein KBT03_04545 [Bacteroidales bacterium]|nr:hypothetical protein [Candidatus Scybalousia scybalohippi]
MIIYLSIMLLVLNVRQIETPRTEPVLMRVTCYLPTGNKTASGVYPKEGMCASNRENLGKYAVVYDQEGEMIGIYLCADTGSNKKLKNGTAIDIYRDDMESAKAFIKAHGDFQYVAIVDKEEAVEIAKEKIKLARTGNKEN